ncbi:NRF domain-containing protein [Caerostris darwini]|uniref:NRF domain-containing protein n=1 Tax=Caerostris darwini TaxID=1538125 RepID=A0AAV4P9K3_9ARAC|nr:NRF domain-containing protein [Caerostris darwini]
MGLVQEYLIMLVIVLLWLLIGFLKPVTPAVAPEITIKNETAMAPKSVRQIEKEVEKLISSVTKMLLPYFVRNSDLNISAPCMSTFIKIFVDLRKLKVPAIKLIDSMAKPPFGLIRGTFGLMGDYDECLQVASNKKGDPPSSHEDEFYHGQYCTVEAMFPPKLLKAMQDYGNGLVNYTEFGKLGNIIKELPAANFAGDYFKFHIGICLPSTCTANDLKEMLGLVPIDFVPLGVHRCEDGRTKSVNMHQMVFLAILALLAALVLSGTVVDAWQNLKNTELKDEQKDKFIEFFLAFSVYSNTKKLLKTEKHNGSEITAINGMYVLGTVLVVIYHTYFLPFFSLFASNGANLGTYLKDFEFTLVVTMGISIEAYFLFSGLLLVYPRFRRGTKNVEINMMKIIIRRYIRLCPSLLFILGIIVILPLVGSGPVWADIFDKAADNTRKWWWTYVLMFNNFLAVKDQNFLYLWFIPCLMQISIIGAILVWMLAKSPKVGICIIIATGVACNIALGVLTALRHYPPTYAIYYYHNREYFEETIYTAPLSHVFSYGIGMLLGYFMAKNPTLTFSKVHVVLGWIAALFLMVGVQLIAYAGKDGTDPNPVLAAVYAATHRTGFSIGLAWTILACTHGYGGVLGRIFSWKGFGPLSKLGYFGYLLHYIVITYHVSNARSPIVFSHYENWMRICGYSVITFFAAYVLYITFELPLTYIESLFLPSRRPSAEDLQNNIKQNGKSEGIIQISEIIPPNTIASWNLKNSTYVGAISDDHSKL